MWMAFFFITSGSEGNLYSALPLPPYSDMQPEAKDKEAHCGAYSSASWRASQRAKWRKVESGSAEAKGGNPALAVQA